jgi:hypothetical protein
MRDGPIGVPRFAPTGSVWVRLPSPVPNTLGRVGRDERFDDDISAH